VVCRGGKILITRRRPRDYLGGLWEFPGGKRLGGESLGACLERELRARGRVLGQAAAVPEWYERELTDQNRGI